MARYKPQDKNSLLLPVVLSERIVPGSADKLGTTITYRLNASTLEEALLGFADAFGIGHAKPARQRAKYSGG